MKCPDIFGNEGSRSCGCVAVEVSAGVSVNVSLSDRAIGLSLALALGLASAVATEFAFAPEVSPTPISANFRRDAKQTVVETEEEEERRAAREWQDDGRKGRVLVRRKEIPTPDKDPAAVCQLIFQSLQNNDDPMLDYGAAVGIKFASSNSAIKDMTPAEYGEFLRNDPEYVLLIDNATCRPAERAKVSADGAQVLQKVELVGVYPDDAKRIVEMQLSKEDDDCWRMDALYFL
eukprot:jgi/Undpi1/68/HiC_scaffold_1.g00068.m1